VLLAAGVVRGNQTRIAEDLRGHNVVQHSGHLQPQRE
jgi:hypothetical protein